MMRQKIARKLLLYALYSAAVTALPVLAATPLAQVVLPALHTDNSCIDGQCQVPVDASPEMPERPPLAPAPTIAPRGERSWWRRGPVRRAVRGLACFVSRPWRR